MSFYYISDTFSMIHVHNKFTIKKHCQDEKDMLEASYNGLDLTRFNKIAIQGTPQMAVDKEALICLSRVYSYYFK